MTWAVKIGGKWDYQLGGVYGTTYSTTADGGMGGASFTLAADSDALTWGWIKGKPVEILADGFLPWYGRVDEADRETGGVTCVSRWDAGRDLPALDGTGASTRDVSAAITQAQGLGWNISRNGVGGTVLGDPESPVSIVELLEMLGKQEGKRVGLEAAPGGNLFLRDDPTDPKWLIATDDVRLSQAGDEANAYAGRYLDSTTGRYATRYWPTPLPSPVVMETVDLTKYGRLSSSQAGTLLAGAAALMQAERRWTNSLEVSLSQITNLFGVSPTSTTAIRGGDMARLSLDVAGQQALGRSDLDVVLGTVTPVDGSDLVTLEPVGVTPQSLEESVEAVAAR